MFFENGADLVLIDSAADRKSAAYPAHTDGVVVTGMLSRIGGKGLDDRLNQEMDTLLTPAVEDRHFYRRCKIISNARAPFLLLMNTARFCMHPGARTRTTSRR